MSDLLLRLLEAAAVPTADTLAALEAAEVTPGFGPALIHILLAAASSGSGGVSPSAYRTAVVLLRNRTRRVAWENTSQPDRDAVSQRLLALALACPDASAAATLQDALADLARWVPQVAAPLAAHIAAPGATWAERTRAMTVAAAVISAGGAEAPLNDGTHNNKRGTSSVYDDDDDEENDRLGASAPDSWRHALAPAAVHVFIAASDATPPAAAAAESACRLLCALVRVRVHTSVTAECADGMFARLLSYMAATGSQHAAVLVRVLANVHSRTFTKHAANAFRAAATVLQSPAAVSAEADAGGARARALLKLITRCVRTNAGAKAVCESAPGGVLQAVEQLVLPHIALRPEDLREFTEDPAEYARGGGAARGARAAALGFAGAVASQQGAAKVAAFLSEMAGRGTCVPREECIQLASRMALIPGCDVAAAAVIFFQRRLAPCIAVDVHPIACGASLAYAASRIGAMFDAGVGVPLLGAVAGLMRHPHVYVRTQAGLLAARALGIPRIAAALGVAECGALVRAALAGFELASGHDGGALAGAVCSAVVTMGARIMPFAAECSYALLTAATRPDASESTTHSLFAAVCGIVAGASEDTPAIVPELEGLCGPVCVAILRGDPDATAVRYAAELLADLLEGGSGASLQAYHAVVDAALAPALWVHRVNWDGLTRLVRAAMARVPEAFGPQRMLNLVEALQGMQRCRADVGSLFDILSDAVVLLDRACVDMVVPPVLLGIFSRLTAGGGGIRYARRVVPFLATLMLSREPGHMVGLLESIQEGLFGMTVCSLLLRYHRALDNRHNERLLCAALVVLLRAGPLPGAVLAEGMFAAAEHLSHEPDACIDSDNGDDADDDDVNYDSDGDGECRATVSTDVWASMIRRRRTSTTPGTTQGLLAGVDLCALVQQVA